MPLFREGRSSLVLVLVLGGSLLAGAPRATLGRPVPGAGALPAADAQALPAAGSQTQPAQMQMAAGWPASPDLLVSEVVTGGASASDEFVEIYNAGASTVSLANLELVHVTATGSTVTRKQTWTAVDLGPGRHLLLANSVGSYAALADGLYSGGFSASGGSLVLRHVDGPVVDALSWGSAASDFVEGAPGPAPEPGSSLERRPGGEQGNGVDTNDNLADTRLEPEPLPQGLAAPPVPATPSPSPTTSIAPTAPPSPAATAAPPTPVPPTQPPPPTPTPTPTPAATAEPTPAASASPAVSTIADARARPPGSNVRLRGRLTTPTGLTESGKGAFVEDATAGIALYLATADWPALPVGTDVVVQGILESRFSQLTVRLSTAADLVIAGSGPLPEPLTAVTGHIGEALEGRVVSVTGVISDGVSTLTDGYSTAIDDGSGPLRIVVATAAGIPREELARGRLLRLSGVVGQRDSSGTGSSGYRLHLRSLDDVEPIQPPPTPQPDPTAAPTAAPTGSPSPSISPAPPAPGGPTTPPSTVDIAAARRLPPGERTRVVGVVTAGPGRILGEQVIAVQDPTAGIVVRLPAGNHAELVPGRLLEVEGLLAAPYGNLELRPASDGLIIRGTASQPAPRQLSVAGLSEENEGLLARLNVTVRRIEAGTTGSLTLIVEDESGEGRVFLHAPVGMSRAHFSVGQRIVAIGIVGDRLGLYRLWPRSQSDIQLVAPAVPGAGGNPAPGGNPSSPGDPGFPNPPAAGGPGGTVDDGTAPGVISIADALRRQGQLVAVEGTVTSPLGLLDADGRRVTLQDASAAILVRLPLDAAEAELGQRLRVIGEVATYYGAPQLTASQPPIALERVTVTPISVRSAPLAAGLEWRLVSITGRVEAVQRDGDAWRAELVVDGGGVPIVGLSRSGIPATALVAGGQATVVGIVRRAYPTARDQRLAVVPRTAADIVAGGAGGESPAGSASPPSAAPPNESAVGGSSATTPGDDTDSQAGAAPTMALADLAAHVGRTVRVGGRVESRDGARLLVNDGTATAIVRLAGTAEPLAPLLGRGLVLNAEGLVERTATGGIEIVVTDAALLRYVNPLTALTPVPPAATAVPVVTVPSAPAAPAASIESVAGPALLVGTVFALAGLGLLFNTRGSLARLRRAARSVLRSRDVARSV